ncbi:long-chain fatty acid--CoA ligase [Gordonia humi]|uniref:Fatty-acyl-CoA synthase n=1 Tax=Gordonia humi TaxID=686429 RepID=A0A840F4Y1_9ACTN|nr:long-chain fatty acid--CoA ligase [Gordonia humi]MBB4137498.1 fatty-acyl-CoA synthase [Gordonia humi]
MKSTMMSAPLSISTLAEHGAAYSSDRAVVTKTETGWRTAAYADVVARARRLANALEDLGVVGDARVGTFMWNNQEHLEAYFAVPSMGAVLHTANIRLTPEQIAYTVNAAGDRVMIVDDSLAATFAPVVPLLTTVETIVVSGTIDDAVFAGASQRVVSYEDVLAAASPDREWTVVDEQDAASICFTTGTTGNPKGVAYSHRSIMLQSLATSAVDALRIGNNDTILVAVPMFHATAWCYPYSGFWAGADLVLLDRFLAPPTIVEAIETFSVTFGNGVPTVWNDVLRLLDAEPDHDLGSLQRLVIGGAAASESLFDGFADHGVDVVQGWGMTESSPLVTVGRTSRGVDAETARRQRLTQGRVISGVEIRIVDQETGEPLPRDGETIGEFELRGPWIAGGYLGVESDGPADKFHDGWLRTGDVGTLDRDGFAKLTDRSKDIIKSGGEWISSVDLENTLAGHPAIRDVTVIGVPDEKWDERPCAVVVVEDGATVGAEDLRTWLVGRVAKFWIPENWVFTTALPRTSVGKIDKKLLRGQRADGALDVMRETGR